ncbi:hypothetical protein CDAR_300531 [Caerostris darwini]|uniref:Uncharacterized protein n=1 Tax=Caerostris darwini TaxID=1538125 RepID=A0AAV4RRS6_9ARAC|nr:hypothetical protein CDAR_300531 [Caerostris darwini]
MSRALRTNKTPPWTPQQLSLLNSSALQTFYLTTQHLSDPSILYFEMLLKEAAALMIKVQKHRSAANNIRSPTWEKASLTIEECSRRIRAICTYTGVPASHLPTKKELTEMKKAKELRDQIAAEAAKTASSTPAPALPQPNSTPTPKRTPPSPDDPHTNPPNKPMAADQIVAPPQLTRDRPIKVVIRGLPGHTPVEDRGRTPSSQIPNIKITLMSKSRTREPMPLCVQMSPSSKTDEIYSLSTLLGLRVRGQPGPSV